MQAQSLQADRPFKKTVLGRFFYLKNFADKIDQRLGIWLFFIFVLPNIFLKSQPHISLCPRIRGADNRLRFSARAPATAGQVLTLKARGK